MFRLVTSQLVKDRQIERMDEADPLQRGGRSSSGRYKPLTDRLGHSIEVIRI